MGDQEVNYKSLVIGGALETDPESSYRGDSFICGAALHAGVISNAAGGVQYSPTHWRKEFLWICETEWHFEFLV